MTKITLDWNEYTKTAIELAEEGSVLIKNDGALPIAKGTEVALWGRMQSHYYKSGTGSGGMVNVQHVTTIREAFEDDPDIKINSELAKIYDDWATDNPIDLGVGWGSEPWSQKEMPVDEELVKKYAKLNETAVIVIARTAGEDCDNSDTEGAYRLSGEEENLIELVSKYFEKSVVLLNVGGIIDMSFVTKYDPTAVMYIWQAGMVGGIPTVNLITGKATPSGRLTDTIPLNLYNHPGYYNFGTKDEYKDHYEEDIFVGYRYFDTFDSVKVRYGFGFGLSYTLFECEPIDFKADTLGVTAKIKVTNVGQYKGKHSVLMYAHAASGRLAKPVRVLAAFGKTRELMPGEEDIIVLKASARDYSSYDDDGRLGLGTGFVLENGLYTFSITQNNESKNIGLVTYYDDVMVEPCESALRPVEPLQRMIIGDDGREDFEEAPLREIEHVKNCLDGLKEIPQTGDKGIKLIDVKNGKNTMDEFIAQIEDEELALIIRGEGMGSPKVTIGTAGAFGGVAKKLNEMGVPALCCSDGPSGMRLDSGKKAFALPNGTLMAASFNEELVTKLFEFFGKEMRSNKIDTILGPGINIHRYPLNGRNFEYFSEDPYLTGHMAVAQIKGLEKNGVTATIKHFALNNREFRRRLSDSVVSERALREIFLRAFEICVREGNCKSIMTCYNKINGTYGAGNYELNTKILREQWGYTGIVMTDWWAYVNEVPSNNFFVKEHSMMARAQNDLYMVCSTVDREYLDEYDTYGNLTSGKTDKITRAELQRCARNILNFAMNTPAMDRMNGIETEVEHLNCPFADENKALEAECYYELNQDETLIEFDKDTTTGLPMTFGITCNKQGFYDVTFTASSDLNPLAQIPMTLYYSSIPIKVVTWNGTEGADSTRDIVVRFATRHSVLRLAFGGNGVNLKSMKVKYHCSLDEAKDLGFMF